jgi:drug/metabolite transporter (DMT)-like permease
MNGAILAGLTSGAFWGFAFLVPQLIPECSPGLIALGRFCFFGLISVLALAFRYRELRRVLSKSILLQSLSFSFFGNSFYYFLLILGIRFAGITASSLIVGLLPVTVAIAGNGGRITRRMIPSLSLITFGILVINIDLWIKTTPRALHPVLGVFFLVSALALWTWYAVANSNFLKTHSSISPALLSSLTGAFTLLFSPLIAWIQSASTGVDILNSLPHGHELIAFILWSALLGIGASWLALWLWNIASHRLLYGFIFEKRFPEIFETIAIISITLGVLMAIRSPRTGRNA